MQMQISQSLREEVVHNVVVDDVVEEHTADPAKVAVNGSESALDVSPGARLVVVHLGVVVVEVGDGDCSDCQCFYTLARVSPHLSILRT